MMDFIERNRRVFFKIGLAVLIPVVLYLGIAGGLILFGTADVDGVGDPAAMKRRFQELRFDDTAIPPYRTFKARDGRELAYRYYPSSSKQALVLIHGSGGHSRYFMPLAAYLSKRGIAAVYTPDLRGHGISPQRRGDVAYVNQLEDDLADLIAMIKRTHSPSHIIVGGHSSGGGLAIRFAGSRYGKQADAYLLLSPYLSYDAPTIIENAGGWAVPHVGRIIGLTLLNNIGVHWFDSLTVIEFNLPKAYRDGAETLAYSHRLNTAFAPRDYRADLRAIHQPLLVVVGSEDRFFIADKFGPEIAKYSRPDVRVLPGVSHIGVVVGEAVRPVVGAWLGAISKHSQNNPTPNRAASEHTYCVAPPRIGSASTSSSRLVGVPADSLLWRVLFLSLFR